MEQVEQIMEQAECSGVLTVFATLSDLSTAMQVCWANPNLYHSHSMLQLIPHLQPHDLFKTAAFTCSFKSRHKTKANVTLLFVH